MAAVKGLVFALLAFNTAAYLVSGSASEAIDSVAWLTLLVLFELETGHASRFQQTRPRAVIRGVRLVATAALIAALLGYWQEHAWLDFVNVALWIGVVALLELGVRRPDVVARHRHGFVGANALLFAALIGLVLAWLLRHEWFDAYDAALWLAAFAMLEAGLLQRIQDKRSPT